MHPPPTSRRFAWLLGAAVAACGAAHAQAPAAFTPRTGDGFADATLADINRYAASYRDAFIDEMTRHHSAPRELVVELLGPRHWTPGDVYFACALASQAGRPCRAVADDFEHDPSGGWGAVAQRLGIAPGSPAFHAIKRGFVQAYDRWARPIRIDAELAPEFPGRRVDAFPSKSGVHERPDANVDRKGAKPAANTSTAEPGSSH